MNNPLEKIKALIRPLVQTLRPYEPEPVGPRIRLDANETPWDVPQAFKNEIWETFLKEQWNRYPDAGCQELHKAIADLENVAVDRVLAGNGSDEIIRDLLIGFAGPGTQTIIPSPTFSMYRQLTLAVGGEIVSVGLRQPEWSLNLEAMIRALAEPNARMTFIASPNNPTGQVTPLAQLEALLQSTDRLVVVDEAYRWFAGQSVVSWLDRYPNLIVLCTLSKTCSLAGLRVGYVLAHPSVIDVLNRVRLPYNVDGFAQVAARLVIRNRSFWQNNVKTVIVEREKVMAGLKQCPGLEVYPSQANFILVRCPQAEQVRLSLARQDIAVRGFSAPEELKECLRITIGTVEENQKLLAALKQ